MLDCSELKKQLRKEMRTVLKSVSINKDIASNKSHRICENVIKSFEYMNADVVFAYMPLNYEANCVCVIKDALKKGKRVCIPKVSDGTCEMDFFYLKKDVPLTSQTYRGAFDIEEPSSSLVMVNLSSDFDDDSNILMLVPALAFDKEKNRLGKGKGFYDRYIDRFSVLKNCICFMGFCYKEQLADTVPCDIYDKKMDKIATDFNIF